MESPALASLPAFLGRFHPLWVHLPIGFLVLLGILEVSGLLSRTRRLRLLPAPTKAVRTLVLCLGALSAAAAAILGWMLAHTGDYDRAAISGHQALGIAAAAAALATLAVHRSRRLYPPFLVATLALLAAAGHAGGAITHGTGFLTARMPPALARLLGVQGQPPPRKPADPGAANVYTDLVDPILGERCVSCHGPGKQNGGLRLDSWEWIGKGGRHGLVLDPKNPPASAIVSRIDLPLEDKGHMPPKGKPQLSDDDLAVLEWWASSAVPRDSVASSLDLPAPVADALATRLGGAGAAAPPERAAVLAAAARACADLGLLIRPMSPDGPWLDVSARPLGERFGDRQIERLLPFAEAIKWLDLGGTSVGDKAVAVVATMKNLERLHLDSTRVTDNGLHSLGALRQLAYLNLRGTAVTDAGMPSLKRLPRLRALYLWETAVSPGAVHSLGETLVDRRKIARWQAERDELGRLIEAERFEGNTGESLRAPDTPEAAPQVKPPQDLKK